MFSKNKPITNSFPSTWKANKTEVTDGTQTVPLENVDAQCQVIETSHVSVQTDEEVAEEPKVPEFDENSLASWLERIAPQVEKEIIRSNKSRAFMGYSFFNELEGTQVKCLHTLRCQQVSQEHIVTDIAWSCTGSIIGVSYGVGLHEDWCTHKGLISFWNIRRSDFSANSPEQIMESSTCVTCINFHPSVPSLVATGTMAGEVTIYDLSKSQESTSVMTGDSGGVSISCLKWVTDFQQLSLRKSASLVAATSAGTILVWNINLSKETMTLSAGFLVDSQDVPREARSRLGDSGGVGLTSLTFDSKDSSIFLLGSEGGAVLLCTTLDKTRSGTDIGEVPLMKCVTSSLSPPHAGRVLQVSHSPFHQHVVHTLGSDNNLRLYSLLQTNKPVQVIFSEVGVTCSQWSPSRPLVCAIGKVSGEVSFHMFSGKTLEATFILPPAEKPSPISSLSYNKQNQNLMAVGDQLGRVFIWELPNEIVMPMQNEQTTLEKLVEESSES